MSSGPDGSSSISTTDDLPIRCVPGPGSGHARLTDLVVTVAPAVVGRGRRVLWWQTLLVAVAGGTLTLIGTTMVGLFNRRAANRAEWFLRVQWAQQLTVSDNDQVQSAGYNALEALAASALATKDDLHLLEHLSYSTRLAELPDQDIDSTRYVVDTGGSSDETGEG